MLNSELAHRKIRRASATGQIVTARSGAFTESRGTGNLLLRISATEETTSFAAYNAQQRGQFLKSPLPQISERMGLVANRNLTSMALGVLTDLAVSDRHAMETAGRLSRRQKPMDRRFVLGMGIWLRGIKRERRPDDMAASQWADDGGRLSHDAGRFERV